MKHALTATLMMLLGAAFFIPAHAHSSRIPDPLRRPAGSAAGTFDDVTLTAAANGLLVEVKRWVASDESVPAFARQRIAWLTARQRARSLSITLLAHPASARLDSDALMASGEADGHQFILISRPRFAAFIADQRAWTPPFTRRERNDFLLGLVHEAVHLEKPPSNLLLSLNDQLLEEERAWHAVDVNVVRTFLSGHEPVDPRFIEADQAIRSCGDKTPCQALIALLAPTELSRR